MTKRKYLLYFILSVYIFIQTAFFPKPLADILIRIFEPKINGELISFSPYDYVRYFNIVVYCGLPLSCMLFLKAAKIILQRFFERRKEINKYINIVIRLANFTLAYLCGVKVYHLSQGENQGLFAISSETFITLIGLLICFTSDFIIKEFKLFQAKRRQHG